MKKICNNCRWHSRQADKLIYKDNYCCHKSVHEEIKGEHISDGRKVEYHKTNRIIESIYIILQTTPPWCPRFEAKPEEIPEEMADKIFRSGEE